MQRVWIYMALGFGASLGTTVYIRDLHARLERLEAVQDQRLVERTARPHLLVDEETVPSQARSVPQDGLG
jgi:hypothetical protein